MSAALRVGLLGFGIGGAVFHAPLVVAAPGLELASVVTADPARQEQVRARHPGVRVLDRAEKLWDAAAEHDLAVVSTPNHSHLPLALAALDAGLGPAVGPTRCCPKPVAARPEPDATGSAPPSERRPTPDPRPARPPLHTTRLPHARRGGGDAHRTGSGRGAGATGSDGVPRGLPVAALIVP